MNHTHIIVDSGKHFIIDPTIRSISYADADKLILIQNDHNSERYTFDIPKVIEGHEVLSSDKIEIHYTNESYEGVYKVEDAAENGDDKVSFSWLISSNATQYVGSLIFVVKIKCLAEDLW